MMTKSNLIQKLCAKKQNLDTPLATQIINTIFDTMANGLMNNKRIEIRGFGTFSLRKRLARDNARDPRTGKLISTQNTYSVYFRLGKEFFAKINTRNR